MSETNDIPANMWDAVEKIDALIAAGPTPCAKCSRPATHSVGVSLGNDKGTREGIAYACCDDCA
jgi:hypothetical protein